MDSAFGQSQMTTWKNPTDKTVSINLYLGIQNKFNADGRAVGQLKKPYQVFEVPPGTERDLPSMFDCAVQQLDAHGVIIGGKAPQLINVKNPAKLHPSLIPHDSHCAATKKMDVECNCSVSSKLLENETAPVKKAK